MSTSGMILGPLLDCIRLRLKLLQWGYSASYEPSPMSIFDLTNIVDHVQRLEFKLRHVLS